MDNQRFDAMTRAFASGTSRRKLLKFLGGGAVAGAIGTAVVPAPRVSAQGTLQPGEECMSNDECASGLCDGVCYCENSAEPWLGCSCTTGTEGPCGGGTLLCCATGTEPGGPGICTSASVGCDPIGECSAPGESCEETGCCELGECSASGFCLSCTTGTENPCGSLATEFGGTWVCCPAAGGAPGSTGTCVEESECISDLPDTGTGPLTTAADNRWMGPLALLGAGAAILGWKRREQENEL